MALLAWGKEPGGRRPLYANWATFLEQALTDGNIPGLNLLSLGGCIVKGTAGVCAS
jgi:hypothetical protein